MMKHCKHFFLFLLCCSFLPGSNALALNEDTHRDIQKFIGSRKIAINGFLLDSYLKDQMGFPDGKKEKIFKKTIFKWLGQGGREEDKPPWTIPYIRSSNHFHNPLEPDLDGRGEVQRLVLS